MHGFNAQGLKAYALLLKSSGYIACPENCVKWVVCRDFEGKPILLANEIKNYTLTKSGFS
jgi:hypothetical protein